MASTGAQQVTQAIEVMRAEMKDVLKAINDKLDNLALDNATKHTDTIALMQEILGNVAAGATKRAAKTAADASPQSAAAPAEAAKPKPKGGKGKDGAPTAKSWFTAKFTEDEEFRAKVRGIAEVKTFLDSKEFQTALNAKKNPNTKLKCEIDGILNNCDKVVSNLFAEDASAKVAIPESF